MAGPGVKAGRAIASFIIPPVGVVTYFIIKDKPQRKKDAKAYLGIALAAIVISGIFFIKYQVDKSIKDKNE